MTVEVEMMSVVAGLAVDEGGSCAERETAWMGLFALGFRNGEIGLCVQAQADGHVPLFDAVYQGLLDDREGVSLAAASGSIFVLCYESVPKLDPGSVRNSLDTALAKYLSVVAKSSCTAARYRHLLPLLIERMQDEDLIMAAGASVFSTYTMVDPRVAEVFIASDAVHTMLKLLYRVKQPSCAPASWWNARSQIINVDIMVFCSVMFPVAYCVAALNYIPARNDAWNSIISECVDAVKAIREAELPSKPTGVGFFPGLVQILSTASRDELRHEREHFGHVRA